jgi:hypothetical protein
MIKELKQAVCFKKYKLKVKSTVQTKVKFYEALVNFYDVYYVSVTLKSLQHSFPLRQCGKAGTLTDLSTTK